MPALQRGAIPRHRLWRRQARSGMVVLNPPPPTETAPKPTVPLERQRPVGRGHPRDEPCSLGWAMLSQESRQRGKRASEGPEGLEALVFCSAHSLGKAAVE